MQAVSFHLPFFLSWKGTQTNQCASKEVKSSDARVLQRWATDINRTANLNSRQTEWPEHHFLLSGSSTLHQAVRPSLSLKYSRLYCKTVQEDWKRRWAQQCNYTSEVYIYSLSIPSCPPDLGRCSRRKSMSKQTHTEVTFQCLWSHVRHGSSYVAGTTQCKVNFAKYVHRCLSVILQTIVKNTSSLFSIY